MPAFRRAVPWVVDHGLEDAAAGLDDASGADVVHVARDENAVDANGAGDDQALAQHLGGVPPPPVARQHAVPDVAAGDGEVLIQFMANRRAPHHGTVDLGEQERVRYELREEIDPPAVEGKALHVVGPRHPVVVVQQEAEAVGLHVAMRGKRGGLVTEADGPEAQVAAQ